MLTIVSFSQQGDLFLSVEFILVPEQYLFEDKTERMELFSVPFCVVILRFFCSTVLLKFLKCVTRLFLFTESCLLIFVESWKPKPSTFPFW